MKQELEQSITFIMHAFLALSSGECNILSAEMPFGKYAGKPFERVPIGYIFETYFKTDECFLMWAVKQVFENVCVKEFLMQCMVDSTHSRSKFDHRSQSLVDLFVDKVLHDLDDSFAKYGGDESYDEFIRHYVSQWADSMGLHRHENGTVLPSRLSYCGYVQHCRPYHVSYYEWPRRETT